MTTGVYIWFAYEKSTGTRSSIIDWAGRIDVERAISAVNKITANDMLRVQSSKYFSEGVKLSISIQEIKTSKVLYRRFL